LPVIVAYTQAILPKRVEMIKKLIFEKVKNIKNLNFVELIAKKFEEEDLKMEARDLDEFQ